MKIRYPSKDAVILINKRVVGLEGQTHSVQSSALDYIDIAAFRFEDEPDFRMKVIKKAAYILERLCCGHPFIDGNKRTAFLAVAWFLRSNLSLREPFVVFDYPHAAEFLCKVAQGAADQKEIRDWLQEQVKKEERAQSIDTDGKAGEGEKDAD